MKELKWNKKGKNIRMRKYLRLIIMTLIISMLLCSAVSASGVTKLRVNGETMEVPAALVIKDGFVPLKWTAEKMGAAKVAWKNGIVTVEVPDFLAMHQYVNYFRGLEGQNEKFYSLPERFQDLNFPKAEYISYDPVIKNKPLTLNIVSGDFEMPWALYDYKVINGTLFVDYRWLNALFLAEVQYNKAANILEVTYMNSKTLQNRIAQIEQAITPMTPEEALALWIRGQQARSGALQYAVLSPELKEKALITIKQQGWVTGGSSPSLGKAAVLETKKADDSTISYSVQYEELLSGAVYNQFIQTITVKRQTDTNPNSWLIAKVEGNNTYYSVLPDEK